jgi:hypothetical protein
MKKIGHDRGGLRRLSSAIKFRWSSPDMLTKIRKSFRIPVAGGMLEFVGSGIRA